MKTAGECDTLMLLKNGKRGRVMKKKIKATLSAILASAVFASGLPVYAGTGYGADEEVVWSDEIGLRASTNEQQPEKSAEVTELEVQETAAEGDIVVLYTNDAHNAYEQALDEAGVVKCLGYAAVAQYKKDMAAAGNYVELVDAGDAIQGGVIGTLSKGSYIAEIMEQTGYSLAVPGNHEYDYGMDNFLSLADTVSYHYISCNFMDLRTGKPVFEGYEIKSYGDTDVAYIGITTPETFTKSTPTYFQDENGNYIYGFCEGNNGRDLYDRVQETIDAAEAAGADYIIAVGHVGTDPASTPWTSKEIIANTAGIDAFLDGHSHSTISSEECTDKNGNKVVLSSTGTKLSSLGKLTIKTDGRITSELVTDFKTQDAQTLAFVNQITEQFDALQNRVVAKSEIDLVVNDPATGERMVRSRETNLGDLCADAYRTELGADIAFVNGGGIRAEIKAGDITYGDIINVHPFGNMACVIEATGQQILDALELGSSAVGEGESGGFLQTSGLTYVIDTTIPSSVKLDDKNMFVEVDGAYRVKNVKVDGKPLDLAKTYTLASHNYMLKSGGDGYTMFLGDKVLQDEVLIDNQVLINYIVDTLGGEIRADSIYADPYGNGRIEILTEKNDDIVVLYTNDAHNAYEQAIDEDGHVTCLGYAAVAQYKKDMEALGGYVELVDAGDAIQGGVIGTLSKGAYIAEIMEQTGYSLAVPGNHEYDYGMDNFLKLAETVSYDYISCNFIDLKTGETVFDGYKMKSYGDTDVAYIGITTPETFTKSTPTYFQDGNGNYIYGFCEGNNGQDLYAQVQRTIDEAKAAGADYVIAVGHAGVDPSSVPYTSEEIIANTAGIDVFLDGHSHSTIPSEECTDKNGKKVLLTSTGTKLSSLGKLTIKADGSISSELITGFQAQDAETLAFVNDITKQFDALQNTVVARTEVDLVVNNPVSGNRMVRSQETNLGDLCADAYRTELGADIAFVNGGGIRATIKKGDITYGDIISVHPFGNMACVVEATGQQILDALELGASAAGIGESGGFLQVSGLTYEIDTNIPESVVKDEKNMFVRVDGEYRVKNVMVGKEALDLTKVYTVASHNYMLKSGGDGFTMFMGNKVLQDEVLIDNQVLINYIVDTLGGKIQADGIYADPYGEGRIKVIAAGYKAPSCAEEGYRYIVRGDETIKEVLPTTGHHFGDWMISRSATETTPGEQYRECGICHIRETVPIGKLPAAEKTDSLKKEETGSSITVAAPKTSDDGAGVIVLAFLFLACGMAAVNSGRKRA